MTQKSRKINDPCTLWMWDGFQVGFFLFYLFPGVGAILLSVVVLATLGKAGRELLQSRLNWAFAGLAVLMILSASLADLPKEALLGAGNFVPYFIASAAFRWLLQTPRQLRRLAWILLLPSLIIVVLGLGQLGLGWSSGELWHTLSGWQLEAGGNPPGRMASAFMYANVLALYLVVVLVLGLGLGVEELHRKSPSKWRLGVLGVIVVGDAVSLLLTQSRNAWGLAFLAGLVFALYLGWRLLVLGISACVGVIAWASFFPSLGGQPLRQIVPFFLWGRLSGEMYTPPPSPKLRITQWEFCWQLIQEKPWLGWGFRHFTPLYEAATGFWLAHPHNLYIMLAAEMGIPATLWLSGIIGWGLAQGMLLLGQWEKQDRTILFTYIVAFVACLLFNLLDVSTFDLRISTLGWLLWSAIVGVSSVNSKQ
ncbi:O-antigen ligase family protein [Spirulina sp. CS-785/01]|uniref:O-antigen ligase family protein n=1 Tax=Spirulina sp. CS-785/01 TaxID=3021716 RepID=UPI00232B7AAE|nr:O-antigen ligase family protein [Spirulina sp. CS-785/01]MDB9312317.1 O-antigen ligase family protein [Spirulina sp. CS-785/01]